MIYVNNQSCRAELAVGGRYTPSSGIFCKGELGEYKGRLSEGNEILHSCNLLYFTSINTLHLLFASACPVMT